MDNQSKAKHSAANAEGLRIPRHLAVTMDGNGRWAEARGRPRTDGHAEGVKALRRLVEYSIAYGVDYVTVFSFSSENWTRPAPEVNFLFGLIRRFVENDLKALIGNNVRIRVLGSRDRLDSGTLKLIAEVEEKSAACTGLNFIVAFNYGGRLDIIDAARALATRVRSGDLDPGAITEELFSDALATSGLPDPDVMLRTSGENRLSNFLLWQAAYAELIFIDTLWPDFNEAAFRAMLVEYGRRDRRFGGLGSGAK